MYFWELLATVSSVLLTSIHVNAFEGDNLICFTLPLVSLVPFFASMFSEPQLSLPKMQIFSVVTFVSIGFSVARHFQLNLIYGLAVGTLQGFLLPFFFSFENRKVGGSETAILFTVCAWVAVDYIITYFLGIAVTFPIQLYRFPLLLQPISVFGFACIDALVIASNSLLGLQIAQCIKYGNFARAFKPMKILSILFSFWILASVHLRDRLNAGNSEQVQVATVSPGFKFDGNISDLIELTRAAVTGGARFVVWPEAFLRPTEAGGSCEQYISQRVLPELGHLHAYLVIGCVESLPGKCRKANLAFTISPDMKILGSYGKQHPVHMVGEESCVKNGYRNFPISGSLYSFSTLICFDMDFADSPAAVSDLGASLILNPSEDWPAARGHFAASVFRAVENRVAIAKADWGWDSAIIQPNGTIESLFSTFTMHRAVLTANVSIYPQTGRNNEWRFSLFPLFCVGVSSFVLLSRLFRRFNILAPQTGIMVFSLINT